MSNICKPKSQRQMLRALWGVAKKTKTLKAFKDKLRVALGGRDPPRIRCSGQWNRNPMEDNESYLSCLVTLACGGTCCGNTRVDPDPELQDALRKLTQVGVSKDVIQQVIRRGRRALPTAGGRLNSFQALVLRLTPVGRAETKDLLQYVKEYGNAQQGKRAEGLRKDELQGLVFSIQQNQSPQDLYNAALAFSGGSEVRPDILQAVEVAIRRNELQLSRLEQISDSAYEKLIVLQKNPSLSDSDKEELQKCINMYAASRKRPSFTKRLATGAALGAAGALGAVGISYMIPTQRKALKRRLSRFPSACWLSVLGLTGLLPEGELRNKLENVTDARCVAELATMTDLSNILKNEQREAHQMLEQKMTRDYKEVREFSDIAPVDDEVIDLLVDVIARAEEEKQPGLVGWREQHVKRKGWWTWGEAEPESSESSVKEPIGSPVKEEPSAAD
uniref:Uncharacterized protein n=1 Tax=viral metagenome TaxID=1070528 RepID=A0A6C0BP92_9ZZZZ